jgi:hypothetical protein
MKWRHLNPLYWAKLWRLSWAIHEERLRWIRLWCRWHMEDKPDVKAYRLTLLNGSDDLLTDLLRLRWELTRGKPCRP